MTKFNLLGFLKHFFYFIYVKMYNNFYILMFIVTKLDQCKINKNYELVIS
jgi:hypothetical protein